MWILQCQSIFILEVLQHSLLNRRPILQCQRERLRLGGTSRHIAHSILSSHRSTVIYLNLETPDLFCKLDSLRVREHTTLGKSLNWKLQDFGEEFNDWHGTIECGGRDIDIQHHFPLRWTNRLMESKPYFTSSTELALRITLSSFISSWWREERSSNRGIWRAFDADSNLLDPMVSKSCDPALVGTVVPPRSTTTTYVASLLASASG
ncbi:hypothetical protein GCK72_007238 [Caenorhabditis remanei]|uniref:Uncharacterized protein n=1 Tax=Caenorhabditis remanei TaxID=31234 RepID=A0A6A5HIP4_CAERE|nr:hypothetical protein GCK72_007238 [Caenorhabditis remanei]KAF1767279.1 hypothetical protein GCK72_007238 [Caenorhabditis remanei]